MPSLQLFLLFLAADAALKLTPADMALTLSRGMTQGFRPAFLSVLGNVAAGFVQVPAVGWAWPRCCKPRPGCSWA